MIRNLFAKVIFACFAVVLFAQPAFATNVGVFNLMAITSESDPAKAAEQQLNATYGKEGEALDAEYVNLQKRISEYQVQAAALSEKARNEKTQELDALTRSFEEKRVSLANKVGPVQQSMQNQMLEMLQEACNAYAKSKKLDLIIDGSSTVVYAGPSADITNDILAEVNKIWKDRGSKFN